MYRLMLLRHAKAVGPSADDFARPLAAQGRDEARAMSAYLTTHLLIADLALVSDAVRTRETAELALHGKEPVATRFDHALYTATADALLERIRQTPQTIRTLVVVAHNPTVHELALSLTGFGDRYAAQRLTQGYPPCGLTVFDFDVDSWSDIAPHGSRLERFVVLEAP